MRVLFYANDDNGVTKQRAATILKCFVAGCERHGDDVEVLHPETLSEAREDADVVCAIGLQPYTRKIAHKYLRTRTRVILFDKGIIRSRNQSLYNRVCIDDGTPLKYLMRERRSGRRWDRLEIDLAPPTKGGAAIVYANNSQKVHDFWGLGPAQKYTEQVFLEIQKVSPRAPLIYRPKRTLRDIVKMAGIGLSLHPEMIEDALENARALVTYGSNCAVNAVIAGIPAVCLGPCAASPVSGDKIEQLLDPPFPRDRERERWLANLAWCQWTDDEFKRGDMWEFIKGELAATSKPVQE